MRRVAPVLAICVAALGAAVALTRVGGAPGAEAAAIATGGDFRISNSLAGLPVFSAAGIGPGDSARGTLEIADTGSVPVAVALSRHDLLDSPGLGGGLLSGALQLTITDVTEPADPVPVYAGPLDSMPEQQAGRIEPGAARTYEFLATLPAAGAGDQNAVQGASVSVAYSWTAIEAAAVGSPEPEPEPEQPRAGPSSTGLQQPDEPVHGSGSPGAPPFGFAVTTAAGSRSGARILVRARCNSACAIVVRGRLRGAAGPRHRGAGLHTGARGNYRAGTQRLRIRVPAGLRRWLAAAPGRHRLRARLTFTATTPSGATAAVRRMLNLHPPRRRWPRPPRVAAARSAARSRVSVPARGGGRG
jgi:hypothetical protein